MARVSSDVARIAGQSVCVCVYVTLSHAWYSRRTVSYIFFFFAGRVAVFFFIIYCQNRVFRHFSF